MPWGERPFRVLSSIAAEILLLRPSTIRMKRKGDKGSPFLIPLEGLKVGEGAPLTRIETKDEETNDRIHWVQVGWNPNARRTPLRYCQLILSKALDRSNFMRILGILLSFKEWMSSWVRMTLSRIWRPSTYSICSLDIKKGRRGFSRLAMIFVMILKTTFLRAMGQKDFGCRDHSSFGIRVRKVVLKTRRTPKVCLDSSTNFQISFFKRC